MALEETDFPGRGKKVGILGVPLGFGAETIGSELGVSAMRLSKIRGSLLSEHVRELGYEVKDYGDVECIKPDYKAQVCENPKYLTEIVAACKNMAESVKGILEDEAIPVILGGDHSIAIGTFSGISSFFHRKEQEIGLIWFDAHADINTNETSQSGNIHGMPLAAILGHGDKKLVNIEGFKPKLNPKFCAHVGARDLDTAERQQIRKLGMRENFFTMSDIDKRGMLACVKDAIVIASQAPGGFAVTFDVDVIDPRFAPGSGTLVRGGITYREAHLALEVIAEHSGMRSFEIVEVNPMLDKSNITVELACELILSALGKTIL
ncbi:MAG TPA: arginase [Pyrinomonadaceae bacterium]|jgi:arginase